MTERTLNLLVGIGTKYGKEKIDLLAKKLEKTERMGELRSTLFSLRGWMDGEDLRLLEEVCSTDGEVSTRECTVALRASNLAKTEVVGKEKIELVWTGVSTPLVPTRRTEQVLLETIDAAERKLFLVSYVAYDVDSIVGALRKAVRRGVKVEILLESTSDYGGRISMDSIASFKREVPEAILYWWNESGASVHAKCVVSDGRVAFVTSANLTGAAMERNMELGVKIEGGDIPRRLHEHLDALVTVGAIERVN